MAQITYADKSAMNVNSSIPATNKCQASDMNEIKSVVNNNYTEMINELYYKNGDTYQSSGVSELPGIISGGNVVVAVDLVLPKRLDNISSVSCTDLTGNILGTSGYLSNISSNTNYANASGYSLTIAITGSNRIRFRIQKSSAWTNITNNSVVCGLINSIKLTFNT